MILKKIVAISLIGASAIILSLLIIGIFVPESVLVSISNKDKGSTPVTTINEEGKVVTETVDQKSGEKTITVTDQTTGQTVTAVVDSNGNIVYSTDQSGNPASISNNVITPSTPVTPSPNPTPTTPPTQSSPSAPVVTLSVSPTTITSGGSATLGWSSTNSPTNCNASGSWSGSKGASGTLGISPTATTTYTLTCNNSGGSGSKSVAITVNPAPIACGQPGGTCKASDITPFNSSGNCRSAINSNGAGISAYAIPSSFLTLHQSQKNITNTLCGKTYSSNLRNATGDHRNGSTLGGSVYDTWISNFYLGPYN
jgi:hypothetical protein